MWGLSVLRPLITIAATSVAIASSTHLGPVTNLRIVNTEISPDGYSRQAVLANGVFPAPLIVARKVGGTHITARVRRD